MPVELKGSCHCGAVRFSVESSTAVPYQQCFCSICRKVGGAGGSINLGGYSKSLKIIQGKEHISVYKAVLDRDTPNERRASSERNFCSQCSSMLWLYDEAWPELIHPFAQAIDSPKLAMPGQMVCLKLQDKPDWVRLPEGEKILFDDYPADSLEDWHKKHDLYVE
ncbi:duf636 domain-containing protein [Moniliophthora roreri MCA 2997]|uniref:Duf636 domain-containing protein n=2 Tax=Moniliophthora roreri TaxID=221103 RepID=V2XCV8_MONRO|nr:duf636 domain-containing protein [Moniliophthora roreri MCA 2997]KAI3618757.1 duf636 domain-containing protein [Moniliophthora roreri]